MFQPKFVVFLCKIFIVLSSFFTAIYLTSLLARRKVHIVLNIKIPIMYVVGSQQRFKLYGLACISII